MTETSEHVKKMNIRRIDLVGRVAALFAEADDEHGDLIGTVLGELVALWIVGADPSLRDDVKKTFNELVDNLIPLLDEQHKRRRQH